MSNLGGLADWRIGGLGHFDFARLRLFMFPEVERVLSTREQIADRVRTLAAEMIGASLVAYSEARQSGAL